MKTIQDLETKLAQPSSALINDIAALMGIFCYLVLAVRWDLVWLG